MSSAQISPQKQSSGTVSPPEPSIDAAEELEPSGEDGESLEVKEYEGVSNLEDDTDYDANILHLSDTEEDEPYDDILEEYGEDSGIDFVLNTGDNYKLPGEVQSWDEEVDGDLEPEDFDEELIDQYIEGQQNHYEGISEIKEEYDVEVGDHTGNHDPVLGSHKSDDSDAFKKAVNERAAEKFDDYDHENLRQYFLDEYDIIDMEGNSVEVNGVKIVGGLTGVEPEIDDRFLKERDIEEFYDEDGIEEIADELDSDSEYGLLGSLPFIGGFFRYIDELTDDEEEVDAEELDLEDVPDELMSEDHENYQEAKEEAMEEYNLQMEEIEPMIEEHDGPVVLSGHQDMDVESEYGSRLFTDMTGEYDKIKAVAGGHTHGTEVYQHEGAVNVNSAETFSEIGVLEDEAHVDQYDIGKENSEDPFDPLFEEMDSYDEFGEFWEQQEEEIAQRAEMQGMDNPDEIIEEEHERMNAIWELREEEGDEAAKQVIQMMQAQASQAPEQVAEG